MLRLAFFTQYSALEIHPSYVCINSWFFFIAMIAFCCFVVKHFTFKLLQYHSVMDSNENQLNCTCALWQQ